MAEPSSNESDSEQFAKLWQLLNTPIGEINKQVADSSSQAISDKSGQTPKRPEKYGKTLGSKASTDKPEKFSSVGRANGEPRLRGFAKRHCASQNPNPNRKQHNFRDTTKRIGFHSDIDSSPIGQTDTPEHGDGKSLYKPGFFTLFLGVFLPIALMVFESSTHYMAQTAFDPFPTPNHLLLFSLIPISNFLNWLAVRRKIAPLYSVISLSTGMALGIAILYSVMFLPLTPRFISEAMGGVGFLGLAPMLSIPITMLCGHTICQLADRQKTFFDAHQLKHLGHTIILVMVLAVELPSTFTRWQLSLADQGNEQAIQTLRQWGSQDVLLRACYERSGEATDILGTLAEHQHPVSVENARNIFYRVTGVSFNSVPIPASFRGTIKHAGLIEDPAGLNDGVKDEFDLDPDIAGELVSGVARGLSVSDSSIAGSLDSSSGVASLDWNFTFENISTIPREARAKILLPPNAVVTKATLWLDDLQRETVIQERDLARNTYVQAVTSHKRDPLLVSMAGKDSVLVQCYPVVKGTKTKIRLHIVAPLVVSSKTEESLIMPTFEERNFAITIPHKIDLSSKSKISLNGTESSANNGRFSQLKKELDNSVMSRFEAVCRVGVKPDESADTLSIRPPQSVSEIHKQFFSLLPETAISPSVREISVNNSNNHRNLTVIVDKSVTMTPYISEIVNGLKNAPTSLPITIMEVKDGNHTFCMAALSDQSTFQNALKSLSESKCEGGQSDGLLLSSALSSTNPSDVLWIHAAQPIANHDVEYLRNLLRSHERASAALFDLQVASGPNVILPESYDYPKLNRIVRTGSLALDITTFLENYAKNQIRRPATMFAVKAPGTASGAMTDLAQVQAYKLAMGRYQTGDRWGAYDLAVRYHLVTPVSSAVVTEDAPEVVDQEVEEKKPIDALFQDAPTPIAPTAPPPAAGLVPGKAGARFQYQPGRLYAIQKKLDRTRFYNAPRQIQIIDERPVVSDFRASGKIAYPESKSQKARQAEGSSKQLQSYARPMVEQYSSINKSKESGLYSKDQNMFSAQGDSVGYGGSAGNNEQIYQGNLVNRDKTSADKGAHETYANTGAQTSINMPAAAPSSPPSYGRAYSPGIAPYPSGRPAPKAGSAFSALGGSTNGTVGPQSVEEDSALSSWEGKDSKNVSSVPQGQFPLGGDKTQEDSGKYARRRLDSGRGFDFEKRESGLTSPFNNAMAEVNSKLNSLSSAAGSPDTMMQVQPNYQYGQGYGGEFEQTKPGFASADTRGLETMLLAIGLAFIAMLIVFFRLLAKMKADDSKTNKGPIQ